MKRVIPASESHTAAPRFRTDLSTPSKPNLKKLAREDRIDRGGLHDILGRVIAHVLDEISDGPHVLIEGLDGVVYYVPHDASIAEARANGKLRPNAFVQLHKAGVPLWTVRDFGDADCLLTSRDAFRATLILDQPTRLAGQQHWSGWLGRYWATRNRETMIASMATGGQSSHLQRRLSRVR